MVQTGALLLDGNTLNYFGKNIPINLIAAVVAEVVLLGGAEYFRITNGLVSHPLFHLSSCHGIIRNTNEFSSRVTCNYCGDHRCYTLWMPTILI